MDEENGPRNRKERRQAARQNGTTISPPTSTPKIKMAKPDRSKPQTKTMLDLYDEKKSLLDKGTPFDPKYDDSKVRDEGGNILEAGLGGPDDEPIGPLGNAVFWSVTLSMIHFTLDVLVYSQYAQQILWPAIFQRTAIILPILFLVVWMLGTETANRFATFKQLVYCAISIAAGCYTIHITNVFDYMFVMKQAPPLGTLWIWSVIEMRLPYAATSVAIDLGYLWWMGYSVT